jgi:hypothetical protein
MAVLCGVPIICKIANIGTLGSELKIEQPRCMRPFCFILRAGGKEFSLACIMHFLIAESRGPYVQNVRVKILPNESFLLILSGNLEKR